MRNCMVVYMYLNAFLHCFNVNFLRVYQTHKQGAMWGLEAPPSLSLAVRKSLPTFTIKNPYFRPVSYKMDEMIEGVD